MDDYYELFHSHGDESLLSYAVRMRSLPRGHPARLSLGQFDEAIRVGIERVKRESAARLALLQVQSSENRHSREQDDEPEN